MIFAAVLLTDRTAWPQTLPSEAIICEYPRLAERQPFPSLDPTRLATANEIEPNNNSTSAQAIPLGFRSTQDQDIDVTGKIGAAFDQDWFRFDAGMGETVGVAVLAIDGNSLDSEVSIHDSGGNELVLNDDHGGIADFYPPESPFPAGGTRRDSSLTFAVPRSGAYFVRVKGRGAGTGGYLAQIRLRRPPMTDRTLGTTQVLFLDFDGATNIDARALFGSGGSSNADLSPLSEFLAGWGIPASREDDLIDAIVSNITDHFDQLLLGTTSKIVIKNSKDDPDPFGQPNVSRVIVGGRISELGISTIGIAQFIDPANYSSDDTAVVLLDLLSAPASNPNSVLSLSRAPGFSVEEAVSHVVASVVSHEACHFLGCWHTDNSNGVVSIIDRGGSLENLAGIGGDGILGTADDQPLGIHDDHYASEGVGRPEDTENVRARVIASLSIGAAQSEEEAAGIRALIAGIKAVQTEQSKLPSGPQFSPQDTIRLLGLPNAEINLVTPLAEPTARRLEKAIEEFRGRLEAIEK